MFIASSSEGSSLAEQVKKALAKKSLEVKVWSDPGIFELSRTTIESLENQLRNFDFSLVVLTPDDVVKFRGEKANIPRDNVIFELGLFIGHIGRLRSFILTPSGSRLKLPTDLAGITPAKYGVRKKRGKLLYDIPGAIKNIRRAIEKAPPSLIDSLVSNLVFPSIVLEHAFYQFKEYFKSHLIQKFNCDAQITVLKRDGTLAWHMTPSSRGKDASIHKGNIISTSFPTKIIDRPFEAIIKSKAQKGWIIWTDSGYSLLYTPIASHSNNRICVAKFVRNSDLIYILEVHQEISGTLDTAFVERVKAVISKRITGLL